MYLNYIGLNLSNLKYVLVIRILKYVIQQGVPT